MIAEEAAEADPAARDDVEIEHGLEADEIWLGLPADVLEATLVRAVKACRAELARADWAATTRVGVLFASDEQVAELNRTWRDKPKPTNVLSWPAAAVEAGAAPGVHWGELAFAEGVVRREADGKRWSPRDYLTHLAVHGLLHCLGHDHEDDDEALAMESAERRILARLGLPDPYAEDAA